MSVDTPILAHESCWTFYDTLNVIKKEAADAVQLDPRFDVGFLGTKVAAGIAEAAGMPVSVHISGELGFATSAIKHLVASGPNFTLANQTEYRNRLDDVIVGEMFHFEQGCLELSEAPGLGVELDRQKVAKYEEYFRKNIDMIRNLEHRSPFERGSYGINLIPGWQP